MENLDLLIAFFAGLIAVVVGNIIASLAEKRLESSPIYHRFSSGTRLLVLLSIFVVTSGLSFVVLEGRSRSTSPNETPIADNNFMQTPSISEDQQIPCESAQNCVELAVTYRNNGGCDSAMGALNKAIAQYSAGSIAYYERGITHSECNKDENAKQLSLDDFISAIEIDPPYKYAYYELGNRLLASNNYESAIEAYSNGIANGDIRAYVYLNRGDAYFGLNDYLSAIDNFTNAISANDENELDKLTFAYANSRLASARELAGFGSAEVAAAYHLAGKTYHQLWDSAGRPVSASDASDLYIHAVLAYNNAIHLEPTNEDLYWDRIRLYISAGVHSAAIEDLTTLIETSPDFANLYVLRGGQYEAVGDIVNARLDYSFAASEGSNDAQEALDRLGEE